MPITVDVQSMLDLYVILVNHKKVLLDFKRHSSPGVRTVDCEDLYHCLFEDVDSVIVLYDEIEKCLFRGGHFPHTLSVPIIVHVIHFFLGMQIKYVQSTNIPETMMTGTFSILWCMFRDDGATQRPRGFPSTQNVQQTPAYIGNRMFPELLRCLQRTADSADGRRILEFVEGLYVLMDRMAPDYNVLRQGSTTEGYNIDWINLLLVRVDQEEPGTGVLEVLRHRASVLLGTTVPRSLVP